MTQFTPRLDQLERNLIINGNMDFFQRGTSISNRAKGDSAATGTYSTADRFKWQTAGSSATARITIQQDTDVPTQSQSGFQSRYSYNVACTTADASVAATDLVTIRTTLEGQDYQQLHGGKSFRFQFWVKSGLTGIYCVAFKNATPDRFYIKEYTIASANTWQKIIIDLPSDTTGTWAFDVTLGLQICWALEVGSNFQGTAGSWQAGDKYATSNQVNFLNSNTNVFKIAQVMLIPQDFTGGSNASNIDVPFQRCGRNAAHELTMCQRYYEKNYNITDAPGTASGGSQVYTGTIADPSGSSVWWVRYQVPKRTTPTFTSYTEAGTSGQFDKSVNGAGFSSVSTSTTRGGENGIVIFSAGSAGDRICLKMFFTADADL